MSEPTIEADGPSRRAGSRHWPLWLALALIAPPGWWAYRGAALELDLALLLSFCASVPNG